MLPKQAEARRASGGVRSLIDSSSCIGGGSCLELLLQGFLAHISTANIIYQKHMILIALAPVEAMT